MGPAGLAKTMYSPLNIGGVANDEFSTLGLKNLNSWGLGDKDALSSGQCRIFDVGVEESQVDKRFSEFRKKVWGPKGGGGGGEEKYNVWIGPWSARGHMNLGIFSHFQGSHFQGSHFQGRHFQGISLGGGPDREVGNISREFSYH